MTTTRIAELVSNTTRLPLLAVPVFVLVGLATGPSGLFWAVLGLLMTSGLSLLYLLYLTRTGRVGDPRRIPQRERTGPLRVVAVLHAAAFLVAVLFGAPPDLRAVLLSYAVATALFATLAPITNLSLHAAGVAGATVCLVFVYGWWALPTALLVPLVVWARTVLGRHTPLELAAGALVGAGGTLASFLVVG